MMFRLAPASFPQLSVKPRFEWRTIKLIVREFPPVQEWSNVEEADLWDHL